MAGHHLQDNILTKKRKFWKCKSKTLRKIEVFEIQVKTFDNIKNFDFKIYDFTIKNNMYKLIYYRA